MLISSDNPELQLFRELLEKINEVTKICQIKKELKCFDFEINNKLEFTISIFAGLWLLHFFNDFKKFSSIDDLLEKLDELKHYYSNSLSIWNFLEGIFNYLTEKHLLGVLLRIKILKFEEIISKDVLGTYLQQSLTFEKRKKLAANYTTLKSAEVLISLLDQFTFSSIIDPFCGSGRLITTYLKRLKSNDTFPLIKINDSMASAVLLAYCRTILILSKKNQDYIHLHTSINDGFSLIERTKEIPDSNRFDLILMNPPFTRAHRIKKHQKIHLEKLDMQYKKFIQGQAGLHVYSLFLVNEILKKGGIIASILPASTILSKYSEGVHKLLLNNYKIKIIASSVNSKSFSEDSGLNEIFFLAKRVNKPIISNIQFLSIKYLDNIDKWEINTRNTLLNTDLAREWNWTIFLREPKLIDFRKMILNTNLIKSGKNLGMNIVRGIEMYGPDFFFVPNRIYRIQAEEKEALILEHSKEGSAESKILRIPKEYLIRILRKPGYYNQFISPKVFDYALSLSESFKATESWFKEYIQVLNQFSAPARRKYGSKWISHIYNQLNIKKPYGHLFLIDKFGISTTGIMAHFFEKKLPATKNFYVLKNKSKEEAKLFSAWLNSTFFIVLFLVCRREIGGSYGRLQIMDYMKEHLFLDTERISSQIKDEIIQEFDKTREMKLPPIPIQINKQIKKNLDMAIAKALGFSDKESKILIDEIYSILHGIFKNLKLRDKN